jgi:hypothetical protein
VRRPSAKYISNFERAVYSRENIIQSRSSITNTFQNVVEKQNPYKSRNRRRSTKPTTASVSSPVYIISVKDSEGNMLRSAHASRTYGM